MNDTLAQSNVRVGWSFSSIEMGEFKWCRCDIGGVSSLGNDCPPAIHPWGLVYDGLGVHLGPHSGTLQMERCWLVRWVMTTKGGALIVFGWLDGWRGSKIQFEGASGFYSDPNLWAGKTSTLFCVLPRVYFPPWIMN